MYGRILQSNWDWRSSLVEESHYLCFPQGSVTPQCDPASRSVRALATDRLDQAFRVALARFLTIYNSAPVDVQQRVTELLSSWGTWEFGCSGDSSQQCTLADYIFQSPSRWQKMTSSPLDPMDKRNGL